MVEDALAPRQTKRGILAARQDRGILDGYSALIVVAIQCPRLQLAAREFTFVHEQVERMLVVITLFTDRVKAGDEIGFGEQRLGRLVGGDAHNSNSIPS